MTATAPLASERSTAAFRATYRADAPLVVRAPGRVNLIGEHTDYNDGFVLPMALPFALVISAEATDDERVMLQSEDFAPAEFTIGTDPARTEGWGRYVHGMCNLLAESGYSVSGFRGTVASDIPAGASLSSSAALEVASGLAAVTAAGATIDPVELARVGQRVENEVMGLPSGIMDQLISAIATDGCASLIDCRSLTATAVPLPEGVDVVIIDTGTRRELVESAYSERQVDCHAAAEAIGVPALRDASLDDIDKITNERVRRRARHVITANERATATLAAMGANDVDRIGQLMNESHDSLRDDFEVSGPALDAVVSLARETSGCLGARMTGGGFAGCAVALVRSEATERFLGRVHADFVAPAEQPSTAPVQLWTVRPAPGANVLSG